MTFKEWYKFKYNNRDVEDIASYVDYDFDGESEWAVDVVNWDTVEDMLEEAYNAGIEQGKLNDI